MIFALAAGVLMSNGETARLTVFHDGARPIPVEIVGLDDNNQEVEITSFPSKLTVGKRPRTVRVKFPSTVTKLCASYYSPSARLLSCSAQLNLQERNRSRSRNASSRGGYLSTLQRALGVLQQEQTEHPPVLLEIPTNSETPQ